MTPKPRQFWTTPHGVAEVLTSPDQYGFYLVHLFRLDKNQSGVDGQHVRVSRAFLKERAPDYED